MSIPEDAKKGFLHNTAQMLQLSHNILGAMMKLDENSKPPTLHESSAALAAAVSALCIILATDAQARIMNMETQRVKVTGKMPMGPRVNQN